MNNQLISTPPAYLATELQVCEVAIDTLPDTGMAAAPAQALLGAGLVVAGIGLLLVLGRYWLQLRSNDPQASMRGRGLALVGALVGGVLTIAPAATSSATTSSITGSQLAQTTAAQVEYSDGCSLIEVSDISQAASVSFLPGDTEVLLAVVVKNRFAGPIALTAQTQLHEETVLGSMLELGVEILDDDAAPPAPTLHPDQLPLPEVTLAEGAHTRVLVSATLPLAADDAAQQLRAELILHLSASQILNPEVGNS